MITTSASSNKRDEILEVASKLFYEQGYHSTGVKQIIDAAGTAKGTFYSHFKSKEELGVAWLKARNADWEISLRKLLNGKENAQEKIIAIFDFLSEWMESCDFRGCAFLNTLAETPDPDNPLRIEIANHKQTVLERFHQLLAEHKPELSEGEQRNLAASLFLLFEGTLVEMQNFRDRWPLDAAKAQLSRVL
ncbi:MAG: TetR/AcrR family transcriptional regulator [Verrucomicrobiota bacterium]